MASRGNILIVHGDVNLRHTLYLILKRVGHHAVVANSAVEAWHCLETRLFDLLVLDSNTAVL